MPFRLLFPLFLALALCVAVMQISPAELGTIDLVVGSAGVAALIASAWLVGEIARTLEELSEQYEYPG
jgi:hypothetical protein